MKIAVTGKGGVGKTTIAATLARLYAAEGKKVYAVDVDPDSNLGLAEGLGVKKVRVIANKIRENADEDYIKSKIPAEDLLGFVHYNTEVIDADREGMSPYDFSEAATAEITAIKEIMDREM